MSKAVLVLDEMPGVCADCLIDHDGECYITGEDLYPWTTKNCRSDERRPAP